MAHDVSKFGPYNLTGFRLKSTIFSDSCGYCHTPMSKNHILASNNRTTSTTDLFLGKVVTFSDHLADQASKQHISLSRLVAPTGPRCHPASVSILSSFELEKYLWDYANKSLSDISKDLFGCFTPFLQAHFQS